MARGLSLTALAMAAGIHKSTLSRWERGKTVPFADELTRVLHVLQVSEEQRRACYQSIEAPRALQLATAIPHTSAIPLSLGELLRVLRLRAHQTQSDAARVVGVSQGLVAKWEKGECLPSSEHTHRLCVAYGAAVEETILLTTRAWQQFDTIPLDKDALDGIVQLLEFHDTTRDRTGIYLALTARYQALYRAGEITEAEASDIYGYYGSYQSWRLRQYSTGQQIAVPTLNSLPRSRGALTQGQREAINANVDFYCKQGKTAEAFDLLQGIQDRVGIHQGWWFDYAGVTAEASGDIDRAIRYYRESVTRASTERDNSMRRLRTVSMLCRNGRFRDALGFLAPASASETRPDVLGASLLNHAWVFAGLGEWNDATAYYHRAEELVRQHDFDDINEQSATVARLLSQK